MHLQGLWLPPSEVHKALCGNAIENVRKWWATFETLQLSEIYIYAENSTQKTIICWQGNEACLVCCPFVSFRFLPSLQVLFCYVLNTPACLHLNACWKAGSAREQTGFELQFRKHPWASYVRQTYSNNTLTNSPFVQPMVDYKLPTTIRKGI